MSGTFVTLVYGAAVLAALLLLYLFEPIHWYWHALSALAALALGLARLPTQWHSPQGDAGIGAVFLLLFTWGVCAPLFRRFHRMRHA